MGTRFAASDITSAVADGTGLSREEIGLLLAAAAVATAVVASLKAVVALRDLLSIPHTRPKARPGA